MEKLASHSADYCETSYWGFLIKSVNRIQSWLKSDKITATLQQELCKFIIYICESRVKWVRVTTAWSVLRLRMEERPPVMEGSCEYIE
jgi:hypothetical protein